MKLNGLNGVANNLAASLGSWGNTETFKFYEYLRENHKNLKELEIDFLERKTKPVEISKGTEKVMQKYGKWLSQEFSKLGIPKEDTTISKVTVSITRKIRKSDEGENVTVISIIEACGKRFSGKGGYSS